jgi:hypothetical protein
MLKRLLPSPKIQLVNTLILSYFLITAIGNPQRNFSLIAISIILILILQNFLLAIIAIFLGISLTVFFLEIPTVFSKVNEQDITNLFILFATALALASALLRPFVSNLKNSTQKIETIFTILIVAFTNIFFTFANNQDSTKALRFLMNTGEDNAVWLDGLASGIKSGSEPEYSTQNDYNKSGTRVMSVIFRTLIHNNEADLKFTDNLLILQRIYFILLCTAIISAGICTFRFAINRLNKSTPAVAIALISALSIYLSFVTFIIYAHLSTIQCLLISILLFSLISFEKNAHIHNLNFNEIKSGLPYIFLLFLIAKIWYPLAPVAYALILILIAEKISKIVKVQQLLKFKVRITLLTSIPIIAFLFFKKFFNYSVYEKIYNEITYQIHFGGGTSSPGQMQIIIFCVILISLNFYLNLIKQTNISFLLKAFANVFAIYYLLIIALSLLTSPHSIDYAGLKLGLFTFALFLPIGLTVLGIILFSRANNFSSMASFLVATGLLLISSGPPTGPSQPSMTQLGFPIPLLYRIENQDDLTLESHLIEKIDSTPDKKVLCFSRFVSAVDPWEVSHCTKFAAGIQGNNKDPFVFFWMQVNLNAVGESDFVNRTPVDYPEAYSFYFVDDYKNNAVDFTKNYVVDLVPNQ